LPSTTVPVATCMGQSYSTGQHRGWLRRLTNERDFPVPN
jgi:hypothetical protein